MNQIKLENEIVPLSSTPDWPYKFVDGKWVFKDDPTREVRVLTLKELLERIEE